MNAPETTCPRCGQGFHCGAADPTPCPCGTLSLGPVLLAALREQYPRCLCLRCLAELAQSTAPRVRPDAKSAGQ